MEAEHPRPGRTLDWSHRNGEGELTTIERFPDDHRHFPDARVLVIYDDETPTRAETLLDSDMLHSLERWFEERTT